MIDAKSFVFALGRGAMAALALVCFAQTSDGGQVLAPATAATQPSQLKVFLDCRGCFSDFRRADYLFLGSIFSSIVNPRCGR